MPVKARQAQSFSCSFSLFERRRRSTPVSVGTSPQVEPRARTDPGGPLWRRDDAQRSSTITIGPGEPPLALALNSSHASVVDAANERWTTDVPMV